MGKGAKPKRGLPNPWTPQITFDSCRRLEFSHGAYKSTQQEVIVCDLSHNQQIVKCLHNRGCLQVFGDLALSVVKMVKFRSLIEMA